MAFNGSGVFELPYNWDEDALAGLDIMSDRMQNQDESIATGLSLCLTRDAQAPMLADLDMGTKKIKNLAAPTAVADATTKKYVDDSVANSPTNLGMCPINSIIMYDGDPAVLPTNWKVCDGTNGTPNLQDKFIIGASATRAQKTTGGKFTITDVPTHTHGLGSLAVVSGGSHTHVIDAYNLTGTVYGISESFGVGGGTADGVFSKGAAYTVGGTPSGSADNGNGARFTLNGNHTHSMQSGGAHVHSLTGALSASGVAAVDITPPYYATIYIKRMS